MAAEFCKDRTDIIEFNGLVERIVHVQCCLQDVNSHIATPRTKASEELRLRTQFDTEGDFTAALEHWIDEYDAVSPPLKSFILPVRGRAFYVLYF